MHPESTECLEFDVHHARAGFELSVRAELPLAGVTGLFGPSGSGKTTLLRLLAGFESGSGYVRLGDDAWADSERRVFVPPHRRRAGYVFQDARLFAHLTVAGNLRFAAGRSGTGGPAFDDVAHALDLGALMDRDVATLSGGERQRVALGRTLLSAPRLLLLDEPLASLDATRKREILPYLESLSGRFSIPVVYVSHAVDEIVRLADRVLVLEAGRLRAQGPTAAVFNDVGTAAALSPVDTPSVLETTVVRHLPDLQLTELEFAGQRVLVPLAGDRIRGSRLRLRVRAADVAIATREPDHLSFRNVLRGAIREIVELADSAFAIAVIDIGGTRLRSHLTRHAVAELGLAAGTPVYALLKTATFEAFDDGI